MGLFRTAEVHGRRVRLSFSALLVCRCPQGCWPHSASAQEDTRHRASVRFISPPTLADDVLVLAFGKGCADRKSKVCVTSSSSLTCTSSVCPGSRPSARMYALSIICGAPPPEDVPAHAPRTPRYRHNWPREAESVKDNVRLALPTSNLSIVLPVTSRSAFCSHAQATPYLPSPGCSARSQRSRQLYRGSGAHVLD